jgi:SAM-dependent methyltransferase
MERSVRVNYDDIAHLYDSQPYRAKTTDPALLSFLRQHRQNAPKVLDVACGTGNQLVANREMVTDARLVGVDASLGMLGQARRKARDVGWIQADAAALPLAPDVLDFVGCQFAFHHFADKTGVLNEAFRVLRPGGRFVLHNLCPQESADWLYYEYFPEARILDLQDFWPVDTLVLAFGNAGFIDVAIAYRHVHFEEDLADWLDTVRRRRDTCSQLQAISDQAYAAGVSRLEADAAPSRSRFRHNHLCLITLRGDSRCWRSGSGREADGSIGWI